MANEEFIVVADVEGSAQDPRIFLAAPIRRGEIEEFAGKIVEEEALEWSAREGAVLARQRRRLGALVLEDKPLTRSDADKVKAAMVEGIRQLGSALPWAADLAKWRERMAFLRRLDAAGPTCRIPRSSGPRRLARAVARRRVPSQPSPADDLAAALKALVPWHRQRDLDRLAPTHVEVPSGSRVAVDYTDPAEPTCRCACRKCSGSSRRRASVAARCRSPSISCRRPGGRCR